MFWQLRPAPTPPTVKRLAVVLPESEAFAATGRTFIAVSPDATRLAYVANQQLHVRPLDELRATPVPGTSGATSPFFSPDGQQIGFWQDGQLKRMAVAGGALQVICTASNPFGVNWASDGTILFGQGLRESHVSPPRVGRQRSSSRATRRRATGGCRRPTKLLGRVLRKT
jgi:hypothetical protein